MFTLDQLAKICEPHEWEYVQAAFDGDVNAAGMLSVSLSNDKRGHVAVAMWRAKIKRDAFQNYLSCIWSHDHRYVIAAAQTRRTLGCMFRYAAFPLPTDLPDTVTVWRGSSHQSFADTKTGYSWTTDRNLACWFAMRFAHRGSHLVLTADIEKRNISLFTNERKESEAVLMRPPAVVKIDGDITDWQAGFDAVQRERESRRAASLGFSQLGGSKVVAAKN